MHLVVRLETLRLKHFRRGLFPVTAGDGNVLVGRTEVPFALGFHVGGVAQVAPHLAGPPLLAFALAVAAEAEAQEGQG